MSPLAEEKELVRMQALCQAWLEKSDADAEQVRLDRLMRFLATRSSALQARLLERLGGELGEHKCALTLIRRQLLRLSWEKTHDA